MHEIKTKLQRHLFAFNSFKSKLILINFLVLKQKKKTNQNFIIIMRFNYLLLFITVLLLDVILFILNSLLIINIFFVRNLALTFFHI